jgi:hypothetical protein
MDKRRGMLLAGFAVLITIAALWWINRTVTPRDVTWNDVVGEATKGGYQLITTEDLAKRYHQDQGGFLLVDTRQEWEYATGHIQGALNFPMEPTWWSRWRKSDALAAFLGPDKKRFLVFY